MFWEESNEKVVDTERLIVDTEQLKGSSSLIEGILSKWRVIFEIKLWPHSRECGQKRNKELTDSDITVFKGLRQDSKIDAHRK